MDTGHFKMDFEMENEDFEDTVHLEASLEMINNNNNDNKNNNNNNDNNKSNDNTGDNINVNDNNNNSQAYYSS